MTLSPNSGRQFLDESSRFLRHSFLPRIERCVGRLSDEDLWQRPNEASNSVGNLILHLCGNVRQWVVSGIGGKPDTRRRQEEFDARGGVSRSELLDSLRSAVGEATAILDRLDPSLLAERRMIQNTEVSLLYAVYHVVEHFSMHTGQIILLTKMRTGSDMEFYDMKDGIPREQWIGKDVKT